MSISHRVTRISYTVCFTPMTAVKVLEAVVGMVLMMKFLWGMKTLINPFLDSAHLYPL